MEDDPNTETSQPHTGCEAPYTNKRPAAPSLWGSACFLFCFLLMLGSCKKKISDIEKTDLDTVLFTTLTTDVHTLISDSGITKYKLEAKYWYTYDDPEKKWVFPEGIYLEQFDQDYTIEASVKADTAYYFTDKRLWKLVGNVQVMNRDGQHFFAETLFWDEGSEEVYSHDPVRIERSEGEYLYAKYGFKSNQTMTKYELYSSSGHLDVEDKQGFSPEDEGLPTDSVGVPERTVHPSPLRPRPNKGTPSMPLPPDSVTQKTDTAPANNAARKATHAGL